MPKLTAWVVCCSDMHHAVGPFMIEQMALDMAKILTAKGGCVYIPVPLEVEAQVIPSSPTSKSEVEESVFDTRNKDRGYL
jgi:hypothetical protein